MRTLITLVVLFWAPLLTHSWADKNRNGAFGIHGCLVSLKRLGIVPTKHSLMNDVPESWQVDGEKNAKTGYEADLAPIIREVSGKSSIDYFEHFLKKRRKENKGTVVLDLFGSGLFLKDDSISDGIFGIRFRPLMNILRESKASQEITGDILNLDTWEKLDKAMRAKGIQSLDLITMRPVGGWIELPKYSDGTVQEKNVATISFIARNVALRMSPTGHFYFVIHNSTLDLTDLKLRSLERDIEKRTPFRLIIRSTANGRVDGALVPKTIPKSTKVSSLKDPD